IVMSDYKDSTVTYTVVSSPFGVLSDIESPGVDGPPVMLEDPYEYVVATFQAPPSPDYMSGPEYPPSLDFVPELVYPEFMPPEDEVLPAEEQPLPVAVSLTADSPSYVPESDPEEDPEEDDDEDPEEDPVDYPANGGDDGNDEDESSDDDKDDDVDIEGHKEDEEHPTPADSIVVALPAVDHAPSAEETEPFETDESQATPPPYLAYRVTARISIRDEPPTPFWSDTKVVRLLAIPTPPPSPLSPWSSPLPQIPSPPLPPILSHYLYEVRESSSAAAARPPGGFRANYGFVATMDRGIIRDLERDVGYGITDTWDEMLVDMLGAPVIDDIKLGRQMTDDLARLEVMSLRTTVLGQQAVITELQAVDRKRQAVITELLEADRMRQAQFIEALKLLKRHHTQMTEFES
ncbi:hypothetical protein Tco_0041026, partial [Tanacetum coccineum]